MNSISEDGQREAIIYVLKKLRRITLDGYKFGHEYYPFDFYEQGYDEAHKNPAIMHEPDALRYLDQKGVLAYAEGEELDESVISKLNEKKYQRELARFGLVDNGTSIKEPRQPSDKSNKRPVLIRATGEVVYKGRRLQLSPSNKQYYVADACLKNWGKQVPDIEIVDVLLANSFDANERVVRDSVPRLNRKFSEIFKVENAFRYKSGYVSIDPRQFESL